ncbi:MAG: MFS transporter [Bacteroidales bacterium]|nr:MFS transporter [Bacteroidales bacterium]
MNNWKKKFTIIWTGQLFSTLSSSVVSYAVIFWLSIETGSAEVLAFATIAAMLPQLLLGLFSGVMIDRWDRKKIMIIADIFIALCSAVIAFWFYTGRVELVHIYILLSLRSVGTAFHVPAMQASIPLFVPGPELMRVAGFNQVIHSVSAIAGPAFAALLISSFDMTYVLLFDVLGAVFAVTSLLMVHIPNPDKTEEAQNRSIFREMKEGLKAIYSKPGLLWLFIFVVLAMFFIMPVSVLFPLMTISHFSGGTYQMSLVEVAWGAGMLLGGALLGILKMKADKIVLINAMYIVLGLSFAFSGVLPSSGFYYFVALTLLGGISAAASFGAFTVVLQTTVEPSAMGRVFSIHGSLTMLPAMIGILQTGFIADRIGITNAFIIAGFAICLVGIASFMVPAIREMIGIESRARNQEPGIKSQD